MISKLHYITEGKTPEEHIDNIQKACASGIEWVQLRLKKVAPKTLLETAKKAREVTSHFQTRLIITDDYKVAKEVNADGVYLEESDVCPLKIRNYLGKYYSIGSTANTIEDCKKILNKKIDYIGLGPFKLTNNNSKPVLESIKYKEIVENLQTETPIIATGGVTLDDVSEIIKFGVYGVVVSKTITTDFTSIPVFHKILNAPSTQEQVYKFEEKGNNKKE